MGKYCKAYLLKQFRQFNQWHENIENIRKESEKVDNQTVEVSRELTDDDVLYLQQNYVVTDGTFQDKNIIFDNVTDEWKEFCHNILKFEVPDYASD